MTAFFHTILYTPIYNLLILLVDVLPGKDLGLAVVFATLIVKVIIMPLSFAALRTTRAMKAIEPELKAIRVEHKDDKEKQALETMALYKKYGVNPFAGFLTLLIQLPIIICLYWVFRSPDLFAINASLIYSFVPVPASLSPLFLGIFSIAHPSIVLAIIAGATQLAQAWYAIPLPPKPEKPGADMQADLGRMMALQMRFVLPIFIIMAAYYTSAAIALYFITSNLVSLVQEYFVRKQKLPSGTPLVPEKS